MSKIVQDPESDAARTDDETADQTREKLKNLAEKGLRRATKELRQEQDK